MRPICQAPGRGGVSLGDPPRLGQPDRKIQGSQQTREAVSNSRSRREGGSRLGKRKHTNSNSVKLAQLPRSSRSQERGLERALTRWRMDDFDYIVVGAGSAGCVLASRLTEDGKSRVLLLEFGGSDRSVLIQMPAALSIPMNMSKYNWGFATEPEPHLGGRRLSMA